MKIAIIGAGVIGVTTAHELSQDGHEVCVFEHHGTAAEEASFASTGLMQPGWPSSLASESSWRSLLMPGAAQAAGLNLGGWPGASTLTWLWHRQRGLRSPSMQTSRAAQFQLIRYSQERLNALVETHQLAHDSSQGALLLWRHERDAVAARAALPLLREWGVAAREIDAERARQLEPALNSEIGLFGALEMPAAQSANTRQFTLLLKNLALQSGCRFEFGRPVARLTSATNGVQITAADTGATEHFDRVVLCTGAAGDALLRPMGLRLPMQPVYGHSISAAIREPLDAPLASVIDARHQVLITRQGQRIRVAGGQSLGGSPVRHSPRELQRLYRVLMDWFPGAARLGGTRGSVQEWRGAQACTHDGAPVVGESPVPHVWLNIGHGSNGWAMACGSARALADRLQGRQPELDLAPFSAGRPLR